MIDGGIAVGKPARGLAKSGCLGAEIGKKFGQRARVHELSAALASLA